MAGHPDSEGGFVAICDASELLLFSICFLYSPLKLDLFGLQRSRDAPLRSLSVANSCGCSCSTCRLWHGGFKHKDHAQLLLLPACPRPAGDDGFSLGRWRALFRGHNVLADRLREPIGQRAMLGESQCKKDNVRNTQAMPS